MKENINYSFLLEEDLQDIAKLYCRTFTGKIFTSEELEAAVENIHKHTSYEGFIGLKATDSRGKLIGFSYGYRSLPGQFYREKLEKQMTQEQVNHWLKDCFEFVELAVDPSHKRMGVGGSLHDKTLDEVLNTTSVLTTSIDNNPAITLYKSKGWKLIKKDAPVISSENLQVILGKEKIDNKYSFH